MNIIGYFHICQKEGWKRSFDMIFNKIKESGLYDNTKEIRIGIVNDLSHERGELINDPRLEDPKFKILFVRSSNEYERPTILHMRESADNEENYYWYVHTKGLRHFGEPCESYVIDWINFLSYWNITKWSFAVKMLSREWDTYGCNSLNRIHYSGNFWWTKSSHLKNLPRSIESYYTAPEDYICIKNDKMFNILNSGLEGAGHYWHNHPMEKYLIPDDFDLDAYFQLNYNDFHWLSYEELIYHYLKWGKNEGRKYKY